MSTPIEDYAIIGDGSTVVAVALAGSIDWWCVPRIDSGAVFAALVGDAEHGRWLLAPAGPGGPPPRRRSSATRSRGAGCWHRRAGCAPARGSTRTRHSYSRPSTRRPTGW